MNHERKESMELLTDNFRATIRRFRTEMTQLFAQDIPLNEFLVLRILDRDVRQMVSKVALELNVSNSHITAVSEKLITKGLVTRSRCLLDRRVVYLEVTEKGNELTEVMNGKQEKYFEDKLEDFTNEEVKIMNELFLKLMK